MVGRVGIEPTVFLMCRIYSPMHSPAMHTCRYKVRLGPRLPAHRGLLTHYGVPPVAATYFATHLRLGGRLRCRSPYSSSPYNLFSRQFQRPLWLTFHISDKSKPNLITFHCRRTQIFRLLVRIHTYIALTLITDFLVSGAGIEPARRGFSVHCSTC